MSEETGPLAQAEAVDLPVADAPAAEAPGHHADHSHGLTDGGYVWIFFFLVVVTGAEVAWSYLHYFKNSTGGKHLVFVLGLLLMMSVKFAVVAGNFMHLKFDSRVLTRLFYFGLFLALLVYCAALSTFHVFW